MHYKKMDIYIPSFNSTSKAVVINLFDSKATLVQLFAIFWIRISFF